MEGMSWHKHTNVCVHIHTFTYSFLTGMCTCASTHTHTYTQNDIYTCTYAHTHTQPSDILINTLTHHQLTSITDADIDGGIFSSVVSTAGMLVDISAIAAVDNDDADDVVAVVEVPAPLLAVSSREWRWAWGGGDGESDLGVKEWRLWGDNLLPWRAGEDGVWDEEEEEDAGVAVEQVREEVVVVVLAVAALLRLLWCSDKEGGLELINILAAWFSWRKQQKQTKSIVWQNTCCKTYYLSKSFL